MIPLSTPRSVLDVHVGFGTRIFRDQLVFNAKCTRFSRTHNDTYTHFAGDSNFQILKSKTSYEHCQMPTSFEWTAYTDRTNIVRCEAALVGRSSVIFFLLVLCDIPHSQYQPHRLSVELVGHLHDAPDFLAVLSTLTSRGTKRHRSETTRWS